MNEPVLTLYASSLCSKWGFSDGDVVREFLMNLMDRELLEDHPDTPLRNPYQVDQHNVLRRLVRERLLPRLPFEIEIYDIETCHNPIRARTVDGREVEERIWSDLDDLLNRYSVEIPWRDVVRLSGLEVVVGEVLPLAITKE